VSDAFEHENFPCGWVATGAPARWLEATSELRVPCVAWRRRDGIERFV
jgi:hypothetical protein